MKRPRTVRYAALLAAGVWLSAAAPAPRPPAPGRSPLLPLSTADTGRITDAGCIFSFEMGRRTMFYSVENAVMVRTKAGLAQCRITEGAIMAFRDAKGPITCGGQRLALKQTGKLSEPPEGSEGDGTTYPATLTIGTGPGAATLKGEAGTAC